MVSRHPKVGEMVLASDPLIDAEGSRASSFLIGTVLETKEAYYGGMMYYTVLGAINDKRENVVRLISPYYSNTIIKVLHKIEF